MLEFALKYSAARLVVVRLALARAHEDVEADDIAGCELELGDVVAGRDAVDDHVVAVDDVPLDLVGEDALDRVALELLGHALDHIRHVVVGGGFGDFALSRLEGVPRCENGVSLAATDGAFADHHGRCCVRGVAIEVRATDAIHKHAKESQLYRSS